MRKDSKEGCRETAGSKTIPSHVDAPPISICPADPSIARQQLKQGRVCERLKRRQVLYIFLIAILKMEYDTKTRRSPIASLGSL